MLANQNQNHFFKFYDPHSDRTPPGELSIYYRSMPLRSRALFVGNRYAFRLPVNLAEKLLNGALYVDLNFTELPYIDVREKRRSETPVSLVISDRYS